MGRTGAGWGSFHVMDKIKNGLEALISAAVSVLVLLHPPSALGREGGMDHHVIVVVRLIWIGGDPEDHPFPVGRAAMDLLDGCAHPRGSGSCVLSPQLPAAPLKRCLPKGRVPTQGCAGSSPTSLPQGCFSELEPSCRFYLVSYQLISPGYLAALPWVLFALPGALASSQQQSRTGGSISASCPGLRGCPTSPSWPRAHGSAPECKWMILKSWLDFWCHHQKGAGGMHQGVFGDF